MSLKIDFSTLSLQDALDLAILIEEEAEDRYNEFAAMLGSRYEGDATDFFLRMAKNEAKHGQQLSERREKLFKDAPRRVSRDMIDEIEAPDYSQPRSYMSPHQAMRVALECEIKAHDFFLAALKTIQDPQVKSLFEELRKEEVEHQILVKRQIEKLPPDDGQPDKTDDDLDEPPALG